MARSQLAALYGLENRVAGSVVTVVTVYCTETRTLHNAGCVNEREYGAPIDRGAGWGHLIDASLHLHRIAPTRRHSFVLHIGGSFWSELAAIQREFGNRTKAFVLILRDAANAAARTPVGH